MVKTSRKMLGETNPADSLPGTIRGDFCVEVSRLVCVCACFTGWMDDWMDVKLFFLCRNVIHGSDSVDSAQREISLWFEDHELFCYEECSQHWIYA